MHRARLIVLVAVPLVVVAGAALVWAMSDDGGDERRVAYAEVQQLFASSCAGCHPVVVESLDLRPDAAYAAIVGVRSVEAPHLPYVVAGDPDRSFLYLKVAGWPGNDGNPIIGARMPFGQGPLPADQLETLRLWIEQGAEDATGVTRSAGQVATPGALARLPVGDPPAGLRPGDGAIEGTVYDARHQPAPGAVVALLVVRDDLPDGEEHYLAGVAGADGRYRIEGAPVGRILIKAYAPGTTYVSRLLETVAGETTEGDVGLPAETAETPNIDGARVERVGDRLRLAMEVTGPSLDRNYTLAVNQESGRVFELASEAGGEQPGTWSREVPAEGLGGEWTFMAISHACNVSRFLTAPTPA